ncbi:hypothetical protein B0T22DRAFT_193290 [Podospora appendiculata]|uniref:Uncharacterized protein n=1 Tax=Podospora appendiculata TaxID=314037 RepID=A0AAE1CEC4_9PEZI|nr:hypothetical protein B0T22DRAFT_193290 [Podospora appendiculata]
MYSKVGFANTYEGADDSQRKISKSEIEEQSRHSNVNLKGYLPKDQPDALNHLYEEEIREKRAEAIKKDPTLAATLHGNKPSKGAMMDKELQAEEEAMLRKKRTDSMSGNSY